MFSFDDLTRVQIEITNRCQASCPMCLRNVHGGIENPNLIPADWSFLEFKKIFTEDVLEQIKTINFCGDFGDPIINNDLAEMCRYVKDNSGVEITINTNGSARSESWWAYLVDHLPTNHKITFAIDGLEDTHYIYRTGTNYSAIIKNATAFINAGGQAEWAMLRFKHNEHQIKQAKEISNNIGFAEFTLKNSKRFDKKFPVLDKNGNISYYIEQPLNSNINSIEFNDLKKFKDWGTVEVTDCFTLQTKELYIDAHKTLMPCCIMGSFLYSIYDIEIYKKYNIANESSVIPIAKQIQDNVFELINDLGGLTALNAIEHGIKPIMNSNAWKTLVKTKWKTNDSYACSVLCSKASPYISIEDQIISRGK